MAMPLTSCWQYSLNSIDNPTYRARFYQQAAAKCGTSSSVQSDSQRQRQATRSREGEPTAEGLHCSDANIATS
jgi:hypothetical protein